MEGNSEVQVERRQKRVFILGSLSFGHGISHLCDQGIPLLIREIASFMSLGNLQVANIFAIRQAGFGVVSLGGGPLVDRLKSHWGFILTGCMVWAAFSYILIGASPSYTFLLIAIAFVSVPGALWHLPATAAVSQRFPDRRGFALSIHGFGGNICNYLGPLLAGVLLTVLLWRYVFFIYAGPALVLAFFVWWSLKDVGKEREEGEQQEPNIRFRDSWKAARNPVVLALISAAVLRGIGLNAVSHWTPFYLEDELGMGHIEAGFHLGLLAGMGIISVPVLGALSDRFGRKVVLVPGFILATILSLLVVSTGDGVLLTLVFAGMGLFSFALHQVIQAAVLDVVGRGMEATTIGVLFGLNGIGGIASPFLSLLIIEYFGGYGSIFYYAAILTALPTVLIIVIPLRQQRAPAPTAV